MTQTTVRVKNKLGKLNKWVIEEETENTYKIFSNGIISEIYKCRCYVIEGQLYSNEIRSNDYVDYKDCWDCVVCDFHCIENIDILAEENENILTEEDREIDLGYEEPDWYGLEIIHDWFEEWDAYDGEVNSYGV